MKYNQGFILPILAVCVWLSALSGCSKDLGNYSYSTVDTLSIEGIADNYQLTLGTSANIRPDLSFVLGKTFAEEDYTYEWMSYTNSSTSGNRKIIHDGKNLDITLPLGIGNHRIYYTVKQRETGITWQRRFTIDIYGSFQPAGWFVLNDISGSSRLDYYQADRENWNTFPVIYRDLGSLIKDVNTDEPLALPGKPLSLTAFTNRDPFNPVFTYRLYVNTDEATQLINITDGFILNKLRYVFTNETISGEPAKVEAIYPSTTAGAYAYHDNNIYIYHYIYSFYGTPINRIAGGSSFPVSKHFAAPFNTTMHAMFFDTQGKRFLRSINTSNAAIIVNTAGEAFNLADVGKDLVWMGHTRVFNGQVVAILKDQNNRFFLARIGFPYTVTSPRITAISMEDITDKLTDISTADRFAMDQQYGYLFYTSGSKLYQYDMDNQIVKLAKDYGSRNISMLKVNALTLFSINNVPNFFSRFGSPGYGIIVGSYDPRDADRSGTVEFLHAPGLMGNLTPFHDPFTGLGKVVDVKYSEVL